MLERQIVEERLTAVFRDAFDDDRITLHDHTTADDIEEWDSLSHISLVLSVEKEFGLRLSAAEVGALGNVGEMIDLIVARASR